MIFGTFNVVLLGENFPVASIKISDFTFNHRSLKETMRIPVMVQGEDRSAHLQVLPDRFEATVRESQNPMADAEHLVKMLDQVFEYAGPKSITAVGHNAQLLLDDTKGRKLAAMRSLVQVDTATSLLGHAVESADVNLYFRFKDGTKGRVAIASEVADSLLLDFNVNYDTAHGMSAREAVRRLPESIENIATMAEHLNVALGKGTQ